MQQKKEKVFLSAQWKHLINLTYPVDSELLMPYLPKNMELALFDGQAHVSLVAFDFLNTKLKGIPVPFHRNFAEINLRFYVKYQQEIGVVFIREYVPKFAIALTANWCYNEPYKTIPMRSKVSYLDNKIQVAHHFGTSFKNNIICNATQEPLHFPEKNTADYFFKEHQWGFGMSKNGQRIRYRVEHPEWSCYQIQDVQICVDFAGLYGKEWGFLQNQQPKYQILALGSHIKVFTPQIETV